MASIDIAIVAIARSKLATFTADGTIPSYLGLSFYIEFGKAPWMGLAAVIALWLAVIVGCALLCSCCGRLEWDEESQDQRDDAIVEELSEEKRVEEKLWRRWWKHQRKRRHKNPY